MTVTKGAANYLNINFTVNQKKKKKTKCLFSVLAKCSEISV